MSTRRASTALCTLAVAVAALVSTLGTTAAGGAEQTRAGAAPLVLASQTPWVTADQPWFNITLGVSAAEGAPSGLTVDLTFYGRITDGSDLQQAMSGTPSSTPLKRVTGLPVTAGADGLTAAACVTVLPNPDSSPPASGPGVCAPGQSASTLTLGCTLSTDLCAGVYAVSVALVRTGASTPLSRFTTFLTYQQPAAVGDTGALRVGVVVPVTASGLSPIADALTDHGDVATTLAVSPLAVNQIEATRSRGDGRALAQLGALSNDQVIDQSYVPINLAALSEAGISGEIRPQLDRGDAVLRDAGLKPTDGPWVDTASTFSQGDAANLATGLKLSGASEAVISDEDLASAGVKNLTFAQPFSLDLGNGSTIPAAAADSALGTRFTANQRNPVLGAEQLLAGLSFVHYENAFLSQARGVLVDPPPGWRPSAPFMDALLAGLSGNPALSPVTVAQFFAQVPAGGNREPVVRQLQPGTAGRGITRGAAARIALDRQQLSSFSSAVTGHPSTLTTLGDTLLTTEARGLSTAGRSGALSTYTKTFEGTTGQVTLGTERTVTFTSQKAAIPVTVLSSAPYPVTVVVTLSSDKFTFPDGNTQRLTLLHPTTSVRVTAQARTSGDRLPIEVTLHTPDGQVLIAHTVLTVHSTEISFVGVALTALAGAVLLVWWVRTWRRSRRGPPAGALTVVVPRRARTLPLRTSAAYVAVGTGVSRVTGLLRFVALAWALGQTTLADSYNLANTTPNMLYDVVLGGVLSATFIPVFVDRLANKSEREAFDSISAVLTVSVVVLLATTLAALVAAPFLIDALTVLDTHAGANQVHRVLLERQVATGFLRWFVIEIAAYGLFALAAALLNTRRRFIAVAWAPIVNNFVCIGILVWFGLWAGRGASLAGVEQHHTQLVLLGLGTSLGVVLQGVALIPSLRRADLGLLRWRWNPRDEALRAVTRLGGWTFGFVLANQIALFVVTILAGSVAGPDPVSSYTYAYAFFQLPYGIVAVTVMSVVTPDLAERWSTGQQTAFLHRMTGGLRAVLALIIPSAVGILLLAKPAVALLLGNGHSTPAETATTGAALAMFALGLPGFCTYLYLVRVLQSMQRTRVAFYLYLVENALNIVLALLLVHPLGVRGLALSLSVAYSVSALLALAVFHQWFGRLAARASWSPLVRVLIASVPMGVVVLVVSNLSASTSVAGLLARVVGSVVAGSLTFGAVVIWLGRRHDALRPPPSRPIKPRGPGGPAGPSSPPGGPGPSRPFGPDGPPGATRLVSSSRQPVPDPNTEPEPEPEPVPEHAPDPNPGAIRLVASYRQVDPDPEPPDPPDPGEPAETAERAEREGPAEPAPPTLHRIV